MGYREYIWIDFARKCWPPPGRGQATCPASTIAAQLIALKGCENHIESEPGVRWVCMGLKFSSGDARLSWMWWQADEVGSRLNLGCMVAVVGWLGGRELYFERHAPHPRSSIDYCTSRYDRVTDGALIHKEHRWVPTSVFKDVADMFWRVASRVHVRPRLQVLQTMTPPIHCGLSSYYQACR